MSCHRIRGERSGINMILLGNGGGKIKNGINFSQRKYVIDLLTETSMLGCKPIDTPIKSEKRHEDVGNQVEIDRYQRLVEKLICLTHTKPDIAFA